MLDTRTDFDFENQFRLLSGNPATYTAGNFTRNLKFLGARMIKECPDANTVIITHCGGGGRASLAAHSLKQLGYNRVYAITAPFDEIKQVFG